MQADGANEEFRIADHKLIRRIGRGSYGQVWLAQSIIGRFRAVKIIRRKDFEDDGPYQRELNGIERFEPVSRSHPGFINVLQVGQDTAHGYFYYVMELGDDASGEFSPESYQAKTIESVLRSGQRLPVDDVIQFGLRLTDALHTLHEGNLIHRDIKPSNILFVGNIPKLADIGLVSRLDETQSLVGTPGYIPPEGPGSRQADIYALGKVFYECLTGLDRNRFPDLPSFLDGQSQEVRFWEINEIVSRACHHDPAVRYRSAREFHAELTAVENGESVVRLHELERKWASAKRWSRVAALGAVVLGSLVFAALREWTQTERERQQTVGVRIASSLQAVEEGSYARALRDTADVLSFRGDERSRRINRLRYGAILGQVPRLTLLQSFGTRISSAEFTPDGESVLIGLADGRCHIIDARSGKVLVDFSGHTHGVRATLSPDGQRVATGSEDNTGRIYDRRTGRQLLLFKHANPIRTVAFHPYEPWFMVGARDGTVTCWNTATEQLVFELHAHDGSIDCVRFSHNGKLMVTTGHDQKARLWHVATQLPVGDPIRHMSWVACAAFSLDDQRLVTGCHDNTAYAWDVDSQRLIAPPIRHKRAVRDIEFSPDGRYILTSGWDNVVKQWNPITGDQEECTLQHSSPVMCSTYSADGRRIVTGCTDGTLRIWDQAGKPVPRMLNASVHASSRDGHVFVCLGETNLAVYQVEKPDERRAEIPFTGKLGGTFLSDDGRLTAILTEEGAQTNSWCHVWSTDAPNVLARFRVPNRSARVAFDRTGESIVLMSSDSSEKMSGPGFSQRQPLLTRGGASNAAFSADNHSAALIAGPEVLVFDFARCQLRFQALHHRTMVTAAAFSPDGKRLVTCTGNAELQACSAQVWDANTGNPVGPQRWHADGVVGAAWYSDSQKFVTVSEDGSGKIWSVTGENPIEVKHDREINSVNLDSKLGVILTASQDFTVRLWDQHSGYQVGPALRFPRALSSARFSIRESQFVTQEFFGALFLNSTVSTDWSQPTLHAVAHMLDARMTSPAAGDEFQAGAALVSEWQQVKAHLPTYFTVTTEQIVAWHRMEQERCRAVKHRRGELFHLDHVLRFLPADKTLLARRAYLRSLLAREQKASPQP